MVPANEKLVIEARIRPEDIDYVRKDSPAKSRSGAEGRAFVEGAAY